MNEMTEYDVVIRNARIVDGVNKEFTGDLAIKDGRIIEAGKVTGDGSSVIDASGLYALPGFIDPHSHGDWGFAWYPNCESAVMQGCTTVVAGQCGGSPAPLNKYIRAPGVLSNEMYEKYPYIYHGKSLYPVEEVNEIMKKKYGWTIDYGDVKVRFKPLLAQLDHHRLNDLKGLVGVPSTAALAKWMQSRLAESLPELDRIDCYEKTACGSVLSWSEQGPALPI